MYFPYFLLCSWSYVFQYNVIEFSTYMSLILVVDKSNKKRNIDQNVLMASARLNLVEVEANLK